MTVGVHSVGSFAVADDPRLVAAVQAGQLEVTGGAGQGFAGLDLSGFGGSVLLTGLGASAATGAGLTATSVTVEITGAAPSAVSGLALAGTVGPIDIIGGFGALAAGAIITATSGTITVTGLSGIAEIRVALASVSSTVEITGAIPEIVSDVVLAVSSGSIEISGGSVATTAGTIVTATAGTITVTAYEPTFYYSITVRPTQVNIMDLVNVALNDVFGVSVRYVKSGKNYTLTGTFTDQSIEMDMVGNVISTEPELTVRRGDMPFDNAPDRGDVLYLDGRKFEVYDWRVDDSDAYRIILKAYR